MLNTLFTPCPKDIGSRNTKYELVRVLGFGGFGMTY